MPRAKKILTGRDGCKKRHATTAAPKWL